MFAKKLVKISRHFRSFSIGKFEDIPSPIGLPLIGTTFSLLASGGPKKLHKYMDKRHRQLGPIFRDSVGPVSAVFLADPDEMRAVFSKEGKYPQHIKPESWLLYNERHNYSRGLFFMDGEEWYRFRKIMNNIIMKGDLSWIEQSCEVSTDLLVNNISRQDGREFKNLEEELYKWSIDVIVSVLVGASSYKECCEDVEGLVKKLASTIHKVFKTTCKLQLLPANLAMKYNLSTWKNFENSVKNSLEASNALLDVISSKTSNTGLLKRMQDEHLDRKDVNRIIVDLILSSGDTTAYTMAWVLYLISKHKQVQRDLRDNDNNTSLLKNVVRETLRLYPVAPFLTRILPENANICGYEVPANTLIVMSIYTSGRSDEYFKNSNSFLPQRWNRDKKEDLPMQQASMPFGIGARSCVGRKIAETQLQMTLSKIVKNFEVEILNERDIEDILSMVSKPSEPLRLVFGKIQ